MSSRHIAPNQLGMLLEALRRPGTYLQQMVCELDHEVEPDALEKAWTHLLSRHEALRRSFTLGADGLPQPRLESTHEFRLTRYDWRGIEPENQRLKLDQWLEQDRCEGFAIDTASMMRVALFQLGLDRWVMVWTSHHALFDGRSRRILVDELFAIYDACRQGESVNLGEPFPFSRYQERLEKRDWQSARDYWKQSLRGYQGVDHLRTSGDPGEVIAIQHQLDGALVMRLRTFASEHGLTLNTLLQASWALLLSSYIDRNDVVIGAVRACRSPWCESAVGLLVNTVPLRVRMERDTSVLAWLSALRAQWRGMREFECAPEMHHCGEILPGRELFETVVSFENYKLNSALKARGGDWKKRRFEVRGRTHYAVVVAGYDHGESGLLLEVSSDRFSTPALNALSCRIAAVMKSLVENPHADVLGICLLTDREKALLGKWNDTATDFPQDKSIQRLFAEQAYLTPEAAAVSFEDRELTYDQLDRQANQAARGIQELGVGRNVPVGIVAERSVEMIVALLGILKAGGAYMPLDPAWPVERVRELAAEAGLKVVIAEHPDKLDIPGVRVTSTNSFSSQPETPPPIESSPEDWAYITFTSGSTGKPRGVCVPHRGVVRLVKNTHYADFNPQHVFFQFAPLSFDASTFEIWGSLLNGAKLVVAPARLPSLEELGRWIKDGGVTTLWLTAALFQKMVDCQLGALGGLKQLLAGGDRLPLKQCNQFISRFPDCILINGYGPTENTTFSTTHRINSPVEGESVPIGKPINNSTSYVLDSNMRPLPPGIEGDLYLGGSGLALGYLKDPELTRQRFVPNPFSPGLLYKSGDRARYQADGCVEFCGRSDGQLKVRGFRIEPGEIEARLLQHPLVDQALVRAVVFKESEKRLVGYVVGSRELSPLCLGNYLRTHLPDYMVPWEWVMLEELPLNTNGKVDVSRLPVPLAATRNAEDEELGPLQLTVTRAVRRVLGIDTNRSLTMGDNFFGLGGNSLAAMQLVSEIENTTGVAVPMSVFFGIRNLGELAEWIGQRNGEAQKQPPSQMIPGSIAKRFPASPAQCRGLREEARLNVSKSIVRKLQFTGRLNAAALRFSVDDLVRRHEILRVGFHPTAHGMYEAEILAECEVPFIGVDLSGRPEQDARVEMEQAAVRASERVLDTSKAPLMSFDLVRTKEDEHVLIFTIHHLICDGWSLALLYDDLAALYNARVMPAGRKISGPGPSFRVFSEWEYNQMHPAAMVMHEAWWRQNLHGELSRLHLPLDFPRKLERDFRGSVFKVQWPDSLAHGLDALAAGFCCTRFHVFFAGYALQLAAWSGQEDIIIGVPISRRSQSQFERVVAPMAVTMPVRVKVEPDGGLAVLIQSVREAVAGVIEHGNFPLERIERIKSFDEQPSPLRQFYLVDASEDTSPLNFHELETKLLPLEVSTNLVSDLRIFQLGGAGLNLRCDYAPDLFKRETAERFVDGIGEILGMIAENPSNSLRDLLESARQGANGPYFRGNGEGHGGI